MANIIDPQILKFMAQNYEAMSDIIKTLDNITQYACKCVQFNTAHTEFRAINLAYKSKILALHLRAAEIENELRNNDSDKEDLYAESEYLDTQQEKILDEFFDATDKVVSEYRQMLNQKED